MGFLQVRTDFEQGIIYGAVNTKGVNIIAVGPFVFFYMAVIGKEIQSVGELAVT